MSRNQSEGLPLWRHQLHQEGRQWIEDLSVPAHTPGQYARNSRDHTGTSRRRSCQHHPNTRSRGSIRQRRICYCECGPVWAQNGYTLGHTHHPAVFLHSSPGALSHQPTASVMIVSHVPVSPPVTHYHQGPSSPWHLSAVNSAGTSTTSDLHGLNAGPPFAPTWQARGSQLDHVSSRNMDDNAHQPEPDLFTPDESPLSESLEQFWEMYAAQYLQAALEVLSYEASSILAELSFNGERPPRVLSEAEIERLPSYKFSVDSHSGHQTSCVVCMCDFRGDDMIRVLPCLHEFHAECIGVWLKYSAKCPICRGDAV